MISKSSPNLFLILKSRQVLELDGFSIDFLNAVFFVWRRMNSCIQSGD